MSNSFPDTVVKTELTINGKEHEIDAPARTSLADLLRDELNLTGTHLGCEHGVCGACTVLLDGQPVRSCITLAASCAGHEITTIEGLSGAEVDVVREALSTHHGLQCGFCTPGMVISAVDIIRRDPDISTEKASLELGGNICRCTGYRGIVNAVCDAARKVNSSGQEE